MQTFIRGMVWRRQPGGVVRAAFSLVEVMLAMLVLAILVIGGAAFIYRSRTSMVLQQYKRAAIVSANERMEQVMRGWTYNQLASNVITGALVENLVPLNGRTHFGGNACTRTTTVSAGVDGCLAVVVSVQYAGPAATVTIESLRSK
jgi:prepilin-type N-terminal cleavage/methylation domain-containing protein